MNKKNIGIKRNIIFAFTAQSVSLILSLFMSLIVPKVIGVEQYGYWQLFLFYAGYVGYALFGINDGIYLRIGGQDYNKLDYGVLRTQYWISVLEQVVLSIVLYNCLQLSKNVSDKQYVFIMVCIFMIINNATGFLSSVLQAVNRTYQFSTSVMLEKILLIIILIFSMFCGDISYKKIIIGYVVSRITALLYSLYCCKELVFGKIIINKQIFKEMFVNIKVGIVLVVSGIASMLILGIGRQFIEWHWGVETFAIISFSLSITNFFLQFINQVSMVMFPMLRLIDGSKRIEIYQVARITLSHLLTGILVFYMPIVAILQQWLPEYKESFKYLIFTLIICIFDGKMQMLFSTYMKVLRKEKALLVINVISVLISAFLCMLSIYVFDDFSVVVFSMALSIAVRSIVSEIYIGRVLGIKFYRSLGIEIMLSILFVISTWFLEGIQSFLIYLSAYIFSLCFDKKNLKLVLGYNRR